MSEIKQFDWLYPDLIPKQELISILRKRYIKADSLEMLDKDELVELYNKYILPLPQRKYRVNRRGQQMTKKQVLAEKKRRLESSEENKDDQPKTKRRTSGNLLTSFDIPSSGSGDRLKPPPSCVNFEKKKIKLNSNSKPSSETVSSSLCKLKIHKLDGVQDGCISSKKIKLSDSSNSTSDSSNSTGDSSNIASTTSNSTSNSSNSTSNSSNDGSSSRSEDTAILNTEGKSSLHNLTTDSNDCSVKEKKNKITKISWP